MATKKLSIKLLVDKKANKVLFAEANSDFVDFLFSLLSLPIATVIKLLSKERMAGCLANLYESVENLNEDYVQPNQNKDSLLKPKTTFTAAKVPLLMPTDQGSEGTTSSNVKYYSCSCQNSRYCMTAQYSRPCNYCSRPMSSSICCIDSAPSQVASTTVSKGLVKRLISSQVASTTVSTGFVKGLISYMVMDDLVVTPMSTVSSIALLNKFNVDSVRFLEEKVVFLGMAEGLELLKTSLHSSTVLTEAFLRKK